MAEQTNVREYTIPLRAEWMKKAQYKRTRRAVKFVKEYIARHMKTRDVDKVKLDVYLNNEMWYRGAKKPPVKIKVRAKKEGDIVKVELVHLPDVVKFAKARNEKMHKKVDKKVEKVEKVEEKTEEEKKIEQEKEKSVAMAGEKIAEQIAKDQKHTSKVKVPKINRMALKK